jgi:hypothetical protein
MWHWKAIPSPSLSWHGQPTRRTDVGDTFYHHSYAYILIILIASYKMPSAAYSFYISRMCGGNSSYQSEPCTVRCPVDCQMSAWSEWGLCDSNCAYGLKNRSAKVVRLASVGGRPCPGPSVQYALCNYPCENFSWLTSPWSECRLVNDAAKKCGRGRKSRTIR